VEDGLVENTQVCLGRAFHQVVVQIAKTKGALATDGVSVAVSEAT
jgi:hypothetical protein